MEDGWVGGWGKGGWVGGPMMEQWEGEEEWGGGTRWMEQ